jgi:hypothetical protein
MKNKINKKHLFVGLFICALPILIYFYHFGVTDDYKLNYVLSNRMEIWGQLGDFIGGTTGTLISTAAFIAVYLTLQQQGTSLKNQEDELTTLKIQSKIARLENILNQSITDLENQLKQKCTFTYIDPFTNATIEFSEKLESHLAALTVIKNLDLNSSYIFPMPLFELQKIAVADSIMEKLRLPLAELILTTDIICSLLISINEISEDDIAIKHYKHRHLITFLTLHEAGLATENIDKCFDFKEIIRVVDSNSTISEILKVL